jgi:invasion protein IalB
MGMSASLHRRGWLAGAAAMLAAGCGFAAHAFGATPAPAMPAPLAAPAPSDMGKPGQAVEGVEVFADWKKMCERSPDNKVSVCFGFQKVSYDVTKTQLLQAVIGYFRDDGTDPTLIVTVPLGAYLVPGLEIRVAGKKPIKADFQYCFSNGCQAAIRLDAQRLTLLKAAAEAEVVFLDAGHQRLSVPMSLKGFGAALGALKMAGQAPPSP